MPAKISHSCQVRASRESSPLFFKLAGRVAQNGFAVPEAGYLEIERGQLLQAAFALFEIFVAQTPTETHHIAARISGKEHPSVFRPKKRDLPGAMTRDMDRGEATRDRLSIFRAMFNGRGFNRLYRAYEQPK